MHGPSPAILRYFVDRSREIERFEDMLDGEDVRFLVLKGDGGTGKSLLTSKMIDACVQRGIAWAQIEWSDSQPYTYLDVMREIRDGTDETYFDLFTDRVKYYTERAYELKIQVESGDIENVRVLEGGKIEHSNVTVHVGHTVEIKDSYLNSLRPDRDIEENEVVLELTRAFVPCLRALSTRTPTVIFLDALEKADEATLDWLKRNLAAALRDNRIPGLRAVFSGRESLDLDSSYFDCCLEIALKPFGVDDIADYLKVRTESENHELATFIFSQTDGHPLDTAKSVDHWIRMLRQQ